MKRIALFLVGSLIVAAPSLAQTRTFEMCEIVTAPDPCATWTLNGNQGEGRWKAGAIAKLTVETLTDTTIVVRRVDTGGQFPGLTAVYKGQLGADGVFTGTNAMRLPDGRTGDGRWRGRFGPVTPEQQAALRTGQPQAMVRAEPVRPANPAPARPAPPVAPAPAPAPKPPDPASALPSAQTLDAAADLPGPDWDEEARRFNARAGKEILKPDLLKMAVTWLAERFWSVIEDRPKELHDRDIRKLQLWILKGATNDRILDIVIRYGESIEKKDK